MFSPWAIKNDPRLHPSQFRSEDAYKDAVLDRDEDNDDEDHPWRYLTQPDDMRQAFVE